MRRIALFACAALAIECAPPASVPPRVDAPTVPSAATTAAFHRDTPDAPFRVVAPSLPPAEALQSSPTRTFRLINGLRVLFLEQHSPGLLSVEVSARAGDHHLGADFMAVRGMWLGTATRSAAQLRAACDAELAREWGWATMGALGVGITALSDRADAAIGLLGEIVTKATFPVADVARILANETHEREARDEAPRAIAERLLPMALYGWSHPDDEQWSLRKEDLGTLTRDDLLNAYESAFDPSTATLVVVGDTTEEALRSVLGRVFGSWTRRKRPTPGRVFPP